MEQIDKEQLNKELLRIADEGTPEEIAELLNKGANPNQLTSNGYSVLMLAVRGYKQTPENKLLITKMLIEHGADSTYICGDYQAITMSRDIEVVVYLLNSGVTINSEMGTQILYMLYGNRIMKKLLEDRGIQVDWQDSVRQVYNRIYYYEGDSLYSEILKDAIPTIQEHLNHLKKYDKYRDDIEFCSEDEFAFYAINRVNELLLTYFQNNSIANHDGRFTVEQYNGFWREVGFSIIEPTEFHPFFCEIYTVTESTKYIVPKITYQRWPCLMFGELLFSRASTSILAHPDSIRKEIAETSRLYWSHKRYDGKYHDMSEGWGSNSQWATRFRCDYWHKDELLYNVNHNDSIDENLAKELQLEVLKYRCRVKTNVEEVDLFYPYDYYSIEKYKKRGCEKSL